MLHGAGLTTRLRIATASKQTLSNKAKPITIFTHQCMHTHTHTRTHATTKSKIIPRKNARVFWVCDVSGFDQFTWPSYDCAAPFSQHHIYSDVLCNPAHKCKVVTCDCICWMNPAQAQKVTQLREWPTHALHRPASWKQGRGKLMTYQPNLIGYQSSKGSCPLGAISTRAHARPPNGRTHQSHPSTVPGHLFGRSPHPRHHHCHSAQASAVAAGCFPAELCCSTRPLSASIRIN